MALDIARLGTRFGPSEALVDAKRALAYAEATNDENPAYRAGRLAPPVFGVVPTWATTMAAVDAVVPDEWRARLLHLEHDMTFHRPLLVGQRLTTTAEVYGIRVRRSGAMCSARVRSWALFPAQRAARAPAEAGQPPGGTLVLEQFATIFIPGLSVGESGGSVPPDHTFPSGARAREVGEWTAHADDDQTDRYRDASGDDNPIHVDDAFARSVGLPGRILHGMCTMAFCGQAVVDGVCEGDPALLRRLALRFSRPVFPGDDVVTALYDHGGAAGRRSYAFEARSQDRLVVTHGRAEVGPEDA